MESWSFKEDLIGGGGVMGREWDDSLSSARELSVKPLPLLSILSFTLLAIKYQMIEKEDLANKL